MTDDEAKELRERTRQWMLERAELKKELEDLKVKYERLLRQFDECWQECHDGSDSACCKAHE